ncbi:MAG: alpha/beta hydrolase [Burkholderiales bacterium]|nr:alpha/beta hydrolase [Burkholderiales bacterium]
MICAGSQADSLWQSRELYAKAPSSDKELFLVEGMSHMDLYDGAGRDAVLDKITPFFKESLSL